MIHMSWFTSMDKCGGWKKFSTKSLINFVGDQKQKKIEIFIRTKSILTFF